jgi:hypothetical protein
MPAWETIDVVGDSRHCRLGARQAPPLWFSTSGEYKIFSPNQPPSAEAFLGEQSSHPFFFA